MARKLYPIGIQTFERIREEDMFYVDKTEYVYRMTHTDGTYFFLSRPRRFGKSLLVSIFRSYFEGLLPNYLEELTDEGDVAIAKMSLLIKQGDMDGAETQWERGRCLGSDREPSLCRCLQDKK